LIEAQWPSGDVPFTAQPLSLLGQTLRQIDIDDKIGRRRRSSAYRERSSEMPPTAPDNVLQLIGGTRLLPLRRVAPRNGARILLKLESENPTGSMKDRMALAMIEAAERDGRLKARSAGHRIYRRQHRRLAGAGLRRQALSFAHRHRRRFRARKA
jgi:threonine synthase